MKKTFIAVLLLFSFLTCYGEDTTWKIVKYFGVSVQVPNDWDSKTVSHLYEENGITEYRIVCVPKSKVGSLYIQWFDTELESELFIKTKIEEQQQRIEIYKSLKFSNIVDCEFQSFKAKKCQLSDKMDLGLDFGTEYFAFQNNNHSYLVNIIGERPFYKSATYKRILSSITVGDSNPTQAETKQPSSPSLYNFTQYEFKQYSLSVPNTLELREENSLVGITNEVLNEREAKVKKVNIGKSDYVFQPAGLDDFENHERQSKALDLYSRILINYRIGDKDDFYSWNDNISMSSAEYNEANKTFKESLLEDAGPIRDKILNITDIKVGKNANNWVYVKQSYLRKGLNGDVTVTNYYLFNNSEMVKLTISYRTTESSLWKTDFDKILDSFNFNVKR